MAWFVYTVPDLSRILVESPLRRGCPLDFRAFPYSRWISAFEPSAVLPNILLTLLLFINQLGLPVGPL
jgi:hypothetical protein